MSKNVNTRAANEALVVYLVAAIIIAGTWRTPGALCAWLCIGFSLAVMADACCENLGQLGAAASTWPARDALAKQRMLVAALGWMAVLASPWMPLLVGVG